MGKQYKKCEICRRNTNVKEKYLLARFPLDKDRCKKWVKAVGIPELARLTTAQLHYSHFVCGKHFSDNQFRNKNSRLKITAIPTLHLLNPPLSDTLLENFPGKKQLSNSINVKLHVKNGVTTAIATYNSMAEHNYFQRIDPSKCDTIAQTGAVAEDKKSHSTPICSSAVVSENENRKEMEMENPGATIAETDEAIDDTEDYSATISSSPVGMSEDQNRKKMEINTAALTCHSPDPTPSNVQSDVSHITSHHTHHSSNVTITNPGSTPSSVQSAVANHSSNVTITNQGPRHSVVQIAVTNHDSSNVNITNQDPTPSSVQSGVANHGVKYYYFLTNNPDPTPSSVQSAVANHSSNVTITNQDPTPSSVQSAVANHSSNVTITNQDPTPSSVQSAVANHSSNVTITNQDPTPSSVQSAVANHSSNVTITNQDPTPSSVQSAVANHSSNVTITNQGPTTSTGAKPTSKSIRKLPVAKVENEVIKKLRADLVKQYRKKAARQLKETRRKLKEAQKKLWAIESIKSPLLKSLIESAISNRKKKSKGKRWSTFTKCLALALYKKAPQAYTYLEKLLPLPTIRTLQKTYQEFQQGEAMNALEQLQSHTEDLEAADTLVFPSADTIVEHLPHEE